MPTQTKRAYFVIVCNKKELKEHLKVCKRTEYRIDTKKLMGDMRVYDGKTMIFNACRIPEGWLIELHRLYYRHPFGPVSDGNSLPFVP